MDTWLLDIKRLLHVNIYLTLVSFHPYRLYLPIKHLMYIGLLINLSNFKLACRIITH